MVKEWIGSGYPYKRAHQKETGNKRTVLINKRTDSWGIRVILSNEMLKVFWKLRILTLIQSYIRAYIP